MAPPLPPPGLSHPNGLGYFFPLSDFFSRENWPTGNRQTPRQQKKPPPRTVFIGWFCAVLPIASFFFPPRTSFFSIELGPGRCFRLHPAWVEFSEVLSKSSYCSSITPIFPRAAELRSFCVTSIRRGRFCFRCPPPSHGPPLLNDYGPLS